jgi:two-component system nitrate/nitrite response regulator NarL
MADTLTESNGSISVLVAHNTAMFAELISEALNRDERLRALGTAIDSAEMMQLSHSFHPDVLLVALGSHDNHLGGSEIARSISALVPTIKIIALLEHSDRELVIEAFRFGARGVFCRASSIDDLCKCVHRVHAGEIWVGCQELHFVLEALRLTAPPRLDCKIDALLTSREQQIARCVAEGLQNKEIASRIGLSVHTVKNYLFRIFDKLGVSNRAELIFFLSSRAPLLTISQDIPADIPQDVTSAFRWAQGASDKLIEAQLMLAEMYRDGRGTRQHSASAIMWFSIAEITCMQKLHAIRQGRERLVSTLQPLAIAEGDRLTSEWLQNRGPARRLPRRKSIAA